MAGPRRPLLCLVASGVAFLGAAPGAAGDPARYVNPLVGTRGAARDFNPGNTFPGATVPFGMLQWSPDTERVSAKLERKQFRPDRPGPRFGYDYHSHIVRGLSLTHLSGAGCPAYGEFPFLPTTERVTASPAAGGSAIRPRFESKIDHRHERASPGYYRIAMRRGGSTIHAQLTATTRTGYGRFTYPRGRPATMLINAGGSAAGDRSASVAIDPGAHEVTGAASSGGFCSQRNTYRVYFAARFDRGFRGYGTWENQSLMPGSTTATDGASPGTHAAQAGAYVAPETSRRGVVEVRVGLSFVSVADAEQNLAAESAGRRFSGVRAAARETWNHALGAVRVGGGTLRQRRTFYTALYHTMIAPRTFSDANGLYPGMDGRVHVARHYTQYADFSGWDVYRSEIPLLAMIHASRASDMIRSLLADAAQSGCLPKWSLANGQTMEMVGDPADAMIASAAAFGASKFSHAKALHAMLKGATTTCRSPNASYLERQGLGPYKALGYIPFQRNVQKGNATSARGSPTAVWGTASTTLEYQSADFAIAQFAARFTSNGGAYRAMMRRSGRWRRLVNPGGRYIEPRLHPGGFPRRYPPTSNQGFAEGSSAQYTWMVPFDPAGLAASLGGRGSAVSRLWRFLRVLNDVRRGFHSPHALIGNEPSLGAPWLFDWLHRPYLTQRITRRAVADLFGPGPAGLPGNDDLGELSSWYVLGALGVYPAVPGVGLLAVSTPLFPHASIRLAAGRVAIAAPGAPGSRYIHGLRLDGRRYGRPWIPYCSLAAGARLRFRLARRPDRAWGATARDRPPSFRPRASRPNGACSVG